MADTASDAFTLGDPLALLLDLVSVRPIPLRDAAGEITGRHNFNVPSVSMPMPP